jgi:putative Holliday junction resolvase
MKPILGVDFGRVRVGLAISDELRLLAHPLETIAPMSKALGRIKEIVRDRSIECVVVGVPKLMSGGAGPAANEALTFVEKLRAVVNCDVVTWDERLTTVAAHRALRETGKKTRVTRPYIDQVAAQMILQGFLDRQHQASAAEQLPRSG